jgi:hypothetical protein
MKCIIASDHPLSTVASLILSYHSSLSFVHDSLLCLDVRNPISEYEVRENIVLETTQYIESEKEEMNHNSTTREPPGHFAIRWEGNKRRGVMQVLNIEQVKAVLQKKNKLQELPRDLTEDDSGSFVPVLALECRGLEPTAFHPRGGEFNVVSSGGFQFPAKAIDLSNGDWIEYDDENGIPVSLTNFEAKFIVP